MKLVEKLAFSFANGPAPDAVSSHLMQLAYQEGFRRARELAADVCDQGDGSMSSMSEHILGNSFRDRIRRLGEEEV